MRYLIFGALLLLNFFLSGAVFTHINIAGVSPDLLICFMVSLIVIEKSIGAAFFGMAGGLLMDVVNSTAIGFLALPYLITGLILYIVCKKIFFDDYFLPVLVVFAAFIIKDLFICLIAFLMRVEFDFWILFLRYILPEAAFSAILMFLIHFLMRRLMAKRIMQHKGSRGIENL